ncbi:MULTISPECIES: RHS repeat-associated core domain-containing protein [unclassified Serratia (in: enterobacteria)]|uniref:RHS repeat-associated core domain-containing protein n=1 Tax=unclassified Serratia (in: enterobacteria) TaxID=2647522 RepID=UPI0030763412
MQLMTNKIRISKKDFYSIARHSIITLLCLQFSCLSQAQSVDSREGLRVTLPNGYATVSVEDIRVQSATGPVSIMRYWNGHEWKFNPQWESLSQSWKNLTGSRQSDIDSNLSGPALQGKGSSASSSTYGCWVWVDEDWEPSGVFIDPENIQAAPLVPTRITPFNRIMGENPGANYLTGRRVSLDYATLCAGTIMSGSSFVDLEAIRRQNELYLGDNGRYFFNSRFSLKKAPVTELPVMTHSALASGNLVLMPQPNDKGYRWTNRDGSWIHYNTQGQIVAYGDANLNTVWFARDSEDKLIGLIDQNGHVLLSLHYQGAFLTEVRDYPLSGDPLPPRTLRYHYDKQNRISQVDDPLGHPTRYGYDKRNRLTALTDREGRTQLIEYNDQLVSRHIAADGGITDYQFDYDDTHSQFTSKIQGPETDAGRKTEIYIHNRSGKLLEYTVNGVLQTSLRRDSGAQLEQETNARGFNTRTTRNEFEQIIRIDHPDGSSIRYKYDVLHMGLIETIDELGIITAYERDAKGNLTRLTEAAGTADARVTEYQNNAQGQPIRITRKGRTEQNGTITPDATILIEYHDSGLPSKLTDPEGNRHQLAFNRAGNLIRYTDPLDHTLQFTLDAAGRLTTITDPLDRTYRATYDKVGNLTTVTNPRGKTLQATYDTVNRITQITNQVSGIQHAAYDKAGNLTRFTDADGDQQTYRYDAFLRLTETLDTLGHTTRQSYTLPDGTPGTLYAPTRIDTPTFTEHTRFNEREWPASRTFDYATRTGPFNTTDSVTYDKRGQILSQTDPDGHTRTYHYNALGQLTKTVDTLKGTTTAVYNSLGRLIQLTDPNSNVYRFDYDRNGQLLTETLPEGEQTRYQYDAAGRLTQRIDPKGFILNYTWDEANRPAKLEQRNPQKTLIRTTTYHWDPTDNLTGWSDTDLTQPAGLQTTAAVLTYDDANRKTGETITYSTPTGPYTLSYQAGYSLGGKQTKLVWPDGTDITYAYSAHGQLKSVTLPGEGTLTVTDYTWLEPKQILLPGGITQTRTHTGLLNLESLKIDVPGGSVPLTLDNTYGTRQQLTTRTRTDATDKGSKTLTETYGYDSELRLTNVDSDSGGLFGKSTETFTLDPVANRIKQDGNTWTYNKNNRLIQRGEGADKVTYTYDDNGNQITQTQNGQTLHYTYDSLNRLTAVRNTGKQLIARYGYDPLNRRIWKEQYRDSNGTPLTPAKRTYYLYSDDSLIAEATQTLTLNADETITADQNPEITTQYGPNPQKPFTTGTLFLKTKNQHNETVFGYYHHDHLDTPIQITDKSGNILWAARYHAFGKATITTSSITSNLRFPGQYHDDETGMHYNWNRYYDPSTGRYVTQDPIGLRGGINIYAYVGGSSVNRIDPLGLYERKLTDREKTILRRFLYLGYYDEIDIENVVLHIGERPFYTRMLNIQAITRHNDVYIIKEDFDSCGSTTWALGLLAHELVHVKQYREGTLKEVEYLAELMRVGYENIEVEKEAYRYEGEIKAQFTVKDCRCDDVEILLQKTPSSPPKTNLPVIDEHNIYLN